MTGRKTETEAGRQTERDIEIEKEIWLDVLARQLAKLNIELAT